MWLSGLSAAASVAHVVVSCRSPRRQAPCLLSNPPHDCTPFLPAEADEEEEDGPPGLASAGEEEEGVGSYHSESERLWAVGGRAGGAAGQRAQVADVAMRLECRRMKGRACSAQREQARSSNAGGEMRGISGRIAVQQRPLPGCSSCH